MSRLIHSLWLALLTILSTNLYGQSVTPTPPPYTAAPNPYSTSPYPTNPNAYPAPAAQQAYGQAQGQAQQEYGQAQGQAQQAYGQAQGQAQQAYGQMQAQANANAVMFPNQNYWAGPGQGSMTQLADIMIRSHQSAMGIRDQLLQRVHMSANERKPLELAFTQNLDSARIALGILEREATTQGNSQMNIFYSEYSAEIPRSSEVRDQLNRYLRQVKENSAGRSIVMLSIGSNSPYGPEGNREVLAIQRAQVPMDTIKNALHNKPHKVYALNSIDGIYGAQVTRASAQNQQQYQNTRLITIYEGGNNSAANAAYASAANLPSLTASIAPIPVANDSYLGPGSVRSKEQKGLWRNHLGMDFAYIPAGTFMMGSPDTEYRRDPDERQHPVTISRGFYMQTTEITQGQWKAVMGSNISHFADCGWNCPVDNVSWLQAMAFIGRLNGTEQTNKYRLPTESEWEYACRAGSTSAFSGPEIPASESGFNDALNIQGWYHRNSKNTTHPVALKQPNAWGLYDMHGNVWEWCSDWYGDYPVAPATDPIGPESGNARVRRGGGWDHYSMFCRAADRSRHRPEEAGPNIGFRLVREAVEPVMNCPEPAPQAAAPAPAEAAPAPAANQCETSYVRNGIAYIRKGIPGITDPSVYIEREIPAAIAVGQQISYKLRVHNGSTCHLDQVIVTEQPSQLFAVTSTNPQADQLGASLRWVFQPLQAGETKEITINGAATGAGDLEHCARVEYVQNVCTTIKAVKPELNLALNMASDVLLCETVPIRFAVTNSGSGSATNVTLTANLPNGMTTPDGKNTMTYNIGTLQEGQARQFSLNAKVANRGTYRIAAAVVGENLRSDAAASVTVRSPQLQVSAQAAPTQYAGRPVDYVINVSNMGDAPANGVNVQTSLAAGMSVLKSSQQTSSSGNAVSWQLPSLAPGANQQLTLTLRPSAPGNYTTTTTASAACSDAAKAVNQLEVRGVSAILLEVADETDPLQVGRQGSYVIVATNQGSVPSTNVQISCQLEDNVKFVSASGATAGTLQNGRVVFAPLPRLDAQGRATWRVVVEGVKPGDVRFFTELRSDQLQRPVDESEATNVY